MAKTETSHTIAQVLSWATSELQQSDSAPLDARVLLCHVLACGQTFLMTWPEKSLTPEQYASFSDLLNQRRQGHPVAYLTGTRDFWSLTLKVSPSTLIPRPETELLVELSLLLKLPDDAQVLDLGTGTGAIALSLASEKSQWRITAVDFLEQAVSLARENAKLNELEQVKFLTSDWFEELPPSKFDLIISNPPYVCDSSPYLLEGDVRFEPLTALTAGEDGLDDIRHILLNSKPYLHHGAWILLEHGSEQGELIQQLFNTNGFSEVVTVNDLAGLPRVTMGQWKD